jgi:hypothetical protein
MMRFGSDFSSPDQVTFADDANEPPRWITDDHGTDTVPN